MLRLLPLLLIGLAQGQIIPATISVPVGTIVKFDAPSAIMPFFIVGGPGRISREGYYTAPPVMPDNPIVPIMMIDLSKGTRFSATVTLVTHKNNDFCNTTDIQVNCMASHIANVCICWDPTRVMKNVDDPTVWSFFDKLFTRISP